VNPRVLLAAAAVSACAGAALAADARTTSVQRIYVAAPVWNGAIFGLQAGYGWGSSPIGLYAIAPAGVASRGIDPSGYFGGLHAGYGFQSGSLALGVIADAELASLSKLRNSTTLGGVAVPAPEKVRIGWNASLRARAGYALIPDLLIYATGGVAFANVEVLTALPAPGSASQTVTGWTIGAGAGYAITRGVSASLEYRYSIFGQSNHAISAPAVASTKLSTHALRTGLTFRFGS
jgi:outer membrane immunogenic protein